MITRFFIYENVVYKKVVYFICLCTKYYTCLLTALYQLNFCSFVRFPIISSVYDTFHKSSCANIGT